MSKAPPLFAHQQESIDFIRGAPQVFDMSDPGTGKTRVHIEAFAEHRRNGGGKCLVIAPKSLLHSAWNADFMRFAPDMVVSVCVAPKRDQGFAAEADVYVTNTDAAKYLAAKKPAFFKGFDTLIIDESSTFKHGTSQRSKAMAKVKKYFKYRRLLSGTPNTNSITDLWHQALILDDGKRLGTSFYAFRASVCEPRQVGPQANMLQWTDRPGAELAVSHLLADITVRHKFEDCIDIPENHEYTMPFQMAPRQRRTYQALEKNAMAMTTKGEVISAINAASLTTKLLQVASGASYSGVEGQETEIVDVANERYELVADLVEQRKHSLVFFQWGHQRDAILREFDNRSVIYGVIDGDTSIEDRQTIVARFQAGQLSVILAHPQSAAHGLTLTKGTTTIWASPTYNLEHYMQGNRRLYRAGQTQKTETITIVAEDTIEGTVMEKLMDKSGKQWSLLDLMKEHFDVQK